MTSQTQTAGRKPRRRFMSSETLGKVVALVVLALGAVVMVFPLAWMFSSSLKPLAQIGLFPPVWIPRE